jgi:hypothetical protein
LAIESADWRLRVRIGERRLHAWMAIANHQSQSSITNLNRQSAFRKSAVINPQSAIGPSH